MTEMDSMYMSEAHKRRGTFLRLLSEHSKTMAIKEDGVQRAAEMYPVEKDKLGYS